MVARALSLPASIFPSLQPRGEETPRLHLFPSLQPHGVEAADRHATPPGRATIGTWFPCCPPPILAMTKDAGGKHLCDFPVASSDLVYSKGCRWKASARFRVVFFLQMPSQLSILTSPLHQQFSNLQASHPVLLQQGCPPYSHMSPLSCTWQR